jgi:carbamoyltransferase
MLGPDKSTATPSSATNVVLGLGGMSRHACAALCVDGRLVGACEQERLTRVRGAGPNPSGLPDEAIDALLAAQRLPRDRIRRVGMAERWGQSVGRSTPAQYDHHLVHAAAAHLTSGFPRAAILVCDHEAPQVGVCLGEGATITPLEWPSREPGPAALYADAAIALGFGGGGEGQHLEAFARLEAGCRLAEVDDLFAYAGDGIVAIPGWRDRLAALGEGGTDRRARVASAVQTRLGDLLLALVAGVRRATGASHLSLAGSLFYNTALVSRIKTAEGFEDTFVPANPGNAGLAVGSALLAADASPARVSAMLGPTFGAEAVKPVLDNCKLAYDFAGDAGCERRAVEALLAGKLVGWFDGPMEWGPRALGARSILASPFSPFVLENLNHFLKHRQPWRGYAVSCLEGAAADVFDGPRSAPHMECDYVPRDRDRFRHVLPGPNAALRVQTVGMEAPARFRSLLTAFGEVTGVPVLVNTSFNGFQEPIVCNPRDAIRVFYGSGIDLLVLDRFTLVK